MPAIDIAGLENLHRGDQLRAPILGPLRIGIGQRRERTNRIAHHVVAFENLAVIAFHRPDGQQNIPVNREALFNALQPRAPFARHVLADAGGILVHTVVDVVPDRLGEFRLITGLLQHDRIRCVDTAKRAVEGRR